MHEATIRSTFQRFTLLFAVAMGVCFVPAQSTVAATRIIVSLDNHYFPDQADLAIDQFSQALHTPVTLVREMSGHSLVITVEHPNLSKQALFEQLRALPGVMDVASDAVTRLTSVDDPRFDEQWQLQSRTEYRASLDLPRAWGVTRGSADVVVAVVDTGIDYNHPDLSGRILPGYDFVSSLSEAVESGIIVPESLEFMRSNDGDGRDNDASDPGDAISETLREQFEKLNIDCYVSNSSWHGTAMASIIAANVNDGIGIAGIDWNAKILPVRAIGKCGGHRSDMLDAIRWAAGVDDPSLPPNPTPARIINLSLGVDDLCTSVDQRAINEAIAAGALVVAAVGNNGRNTDAEPSSPSHCQNVIGVMAVDKYGFRAGYSNFGRDADIAAPGGDLSPSPNSILVATNNGTDFPTSEFGYRPATGTSVAAPHVAGVLALMLSVKPDLNNRELEALLLDSTGDYPGEGDRMYDPQFSCSKALCGAGILDAFAAVQAVDAHEPGIFLDSPSLAAAQSVPVSVGGYSGFGCTVSLRRSNDPMWMFLCFAAVLIIARRRFKPTQTLRV